MPFAASTAKVRNGPLSTPGMEGQILEVCCKRELAADDTRKQVTAISGLLQGDDRSEKTGTKPLHAQAVRLLAAKYHGI